MIRTSIIPQNTDVLISIPQNYVGKEIEIFFYAVDELIQQKPQTPKLKLSELAGTLSDETAEKLQKYVTDSRNEWDERLKQ
jgi:hypothetical protein